MKQRILFSKIPRKRETARGSTVASKRIWSAIFILIVLQVIGIARNYFSHYSIYFWFCDFAPALLAGAFFLKKTQFVKGIINVGLLAQTGYLLAFFYRLFSGVALIALPEHLTLGYTLSSLALHTSTGIALLYTLREKPRLSALYYSFVCLIIIYFMTLLFTNADADVNYVSDPGRLTLLASPHYTLFWIPLVLGAIVFPTQLLQFLIYKMAFWKRKDRQRV